MSHFYEEPVRLGVERAGNISQAFLCESGVLIPLHRCSRKFATFARSANAPVGIDDPTPAEADLSVPSAWKPAVTDSRYKFRDLVIRIDKPNQDNHISENERANS